jgi:hypothetical protein
MSSLDCCSFIRQMMALANLPILVLRHSYTALLERSAAITTLYPPLADLATYYQDTWLNGAFPLRMWNVYAENTRTNNAVEGWHNRLNRAVRRHHPNVLDLVEVLREEQAAIDTTVEAARQGVPPPRRRRKYREIDERLQNLRADFTDGTLNPERFLYLCRNTVHNF